MAGTIKSLSMVALELEYFAELLDGPGVEGHEREWLDYVKRHLSDLSRDVWQIQQALVQAIAPELLRDAARQPWHEEEGESYART